MNVIRWAGWMTDRGWPVHLVCQAESPLSKRASESVLPASKIRPSFKYLDPALIRTLRQLIRSRGTRTLVVCQSYEIAAAAFTKWLGRGKVRLVYWQHMQVGRPKRDFLHTLSYGQIDRWVAPLPGLAEQAVALTPIQQSRIRIIPFGTDANLTLEHGGDRTSYRKEIGLPPNGTVAGIVGRLDPQKGQQVALAALKLLHGEHLPVHLLLVGSPTHGEGEGFVAELRDEIARCGLDPFVHFRKHVPNPAVAYGAIDIFLMTSFSETFGMVTVEAMAAGLPVIATSSGGTPEIVRHERTGLLVPPRDPVALAAAIKRIMTDPTLANRLGKAAHAEARTRFSAERFCDDWERLLFDLQAP